MDTTLLSTSAWLLSRDGHEIGRAEVATWHDNTGSYIRVGFTLLWMRDCNITGDRITCTLSGMTILL